MSVSNDAKQRQSLDGEGKRPTDSTLSQIPSQSASGLPEGWMTKLVPRKNGSSSDRYFFSPAKSYKFRSKAQVKRFQASLMRRVCEVVTIELKRRARRRRRDIYHLYFTSGPRRLNQASVRYASLSQMATVSFLIRTMRFAWRVTIRASRVSKISYGSTAFPDTTMSTLARFSSRSLFYTRMIVSLWVVRILLPRSSQSDETRPRRGTYYSRRFTITLLIFLLRYQRG